MNHVQIVNSWPISAARPSLAGSQARKLAKCHDRQLPTRSGLCVCQLLLCQQVEGVKGCSDNKINPDVT